MNSARLTLIEQPLPRPLTPGLQAIMETLDNAGVQFCIYGGAVRDWYMFGETVPPKDYDIAIDIADLKPLGRLIRAQKLPWAPLKLHEPHKRFLKRLRHDKAQGKAIGPEHLSRQKWPLVANTTMAVGEAKIAVQLITLNDSTPSLAAKVLDTNLGICALMLQQGRLYCRADFYNDRDNRCITINAIQGDTPRAQLRSLLRNIDHARRLQARPEWQGWPIVLGYEAQKAVLAHMILT